MKELTAPPSRLAVAALLLAGFQLAAAQSPFGLQAPKTIIARKIDDLHAIVLDVCILIALVVFGVMLYSILTF